ncbi:hypothetical protein D3C84_718080 [compost metagenome]
MVVLPAAAGRLQYSVGDLVAVGTQTGLANPAPVQHRLPVAVDADAADIFQLQQRQITELYPAVPAAIGLIAGKYAGRPTQA